VRVQRAYILRMGGKSIRTRRLDCNDGAIRRVARQKVPDPKLRNESCRQVSLSQVRDGCDPHDGNEHTPRAIASRWRSLSATMWSSRSRLQLPIQRSATPFCLGTPERGSHRVQGRCVEEAKEAFLGPSPAHFRGHLTAPINAHGSLQSQMIA
jgi:hypothetical protein